MYTPSITKHRKSLRQSICSFYPGVEPATIFRRICPRGSSIIGMADLEPYCEKGSVPACSLEMVFAPYNVKNVQISKNQFIHFMNDDLPRYEKETAKTSSLSKRQNFILTKFIGNLRVKFGSTITQRWTSALSRNPPNTINTSLRVSALCHLFYEMNLPFTVSEFVDSLFAFYGSKIESITFKQFGELFSSIQ
ncbi:hypothetical protein TRFO_23605 [Tritrichomonas foetus]|uniref:Uncharacterized protein n=1 Tax=Tritrichomonas foetus TaxID=1144522 RepID=A0A1J4K9G3_9EUKA|nr:hypothetical protein TRFO_23605 [Tritrichomonas foetus]|eukprot:OHT08063.1 hypothetical protein TRFO_23605 [Tritrichomonas foetus]